MTVKKFNYARLEQPLVYLVKKTSITPLRVAKKTTNGWYHCTDDEGREVVFRVHSGYLYEDFTEAVAKAIDSAVTTREARTLAAQIIRLSCERRLQAIHD